MSQAQYLQASNWCVMIRELWWKMHIIYWSCYANSYIYLPNQQSEKLGGGGLYHLYYFVSVFSPFSKIDLDVESDFACICTIILFICHLGNVSLVLIFFLCLKFLFPFPVQSFHFKEGGSCFYRIMRQYHHIAGTWAWKNVRSYESKYMSLCL